jgi:hypothetical protein
VLTRLAAIEWSEFVYGDWYGAVGGKYFLLLGFESLGLGD